MTTEYQPSDTNGGSLLTNPSFLNESSQIRAHALFADLGEHVPPFTPTYEIRRMHRNAHAALIDIERRLRGPSSSDDIILLGKARELGEIWENLSKLDNTSTRVLSQINAILAYELSGNQANSICIARRLHANTPEHHMSPILRMTSTFFLRQFFQTIKLSNEFSQEPNFSDMTPQQIMSSVAQGLLAHAVGDAARYFLSGNDALLSRAMSALQLARDSYGNTGDIFNYTLASLLHETLPRTTKRSTWNVLGEILPNNYLWQRYLTLLSRGLGEDITTNTGIVELWPSQISALEHGLLQSESSFVAKMPTSAGKTRIAEMAMVHFLINNPKLKCVYISPFRALSGELEQSLSGLFSDLGFKVSAAFGGFERDDSELDFLNESNVIITTPQRLDYVLRVAPELYRQVGLVILDEGQLISDSTRGGHFENTITRIRRRRPETRFLTLSAVIADETLTQIGDWLGSEARVSSSSWRPTSQRVAKFTWRRNDGYLSFVESVDDPFRTQGFVPRIAESKNYEYRNPSSGRIKREVFPSTDHKAKTAAELAFRLSKAGPVLVFCTQRNWVENVAEAFVQRIALMRLSGEDIPSRFSNFATLSSRLAEEWMGEDL